MDDITAIFVAASVVVALLLVAGIVGVVIFARRNDAPPDRDLNRTFRTPDDRQTGK